MILIHLIRLTLKPWEAMEIIPILTLWQADRLMASLPDHIKAQYGLEEN